MTRTRAAWIAGGLVLVVVLVVLRATGSSAGPPDGEPGSATATAPRGAAALRSLLEAQGHPVLDALGSDLRVPRDTATLFVITPQRRDAVDEAALRGVLGRGGTVVVADPDPTGLVDGLLPGGTLGDATGEAPRINRRLAPVAQTAGVRRTVGNGGVALRGGTPLPILGSGAGASGVLVRVGRGVLVVLTDAGPLENRNLARADNAALATALAGDPSGRVVFAEGAHGRDTGTGLGALPGGWKRALLGIALAALLWLAASARRLGPPEPHERELAPSRAEDLAALTATVARTTDPRVVVASVRDAGRATLVRRTGHAAADDPRALRETAAALGLDRLETEALLGDIENDDTALAAGRALAKLNDRGDRT